MSGLRPMVPVPPQPWWVLPRHRPWQGAPVCDGERNSTNTGLAPGECRQGELELFHHSGWRDGSELAGSQGSLALDWDLSCLATNRWHPCLFTHRAPEHATWLKENYLPFKVGKPPFAYEKLGLNCYRQSGWSLEDFPLETLPFKTQEEPLFLYVSCWGVKLLDKLLNSKIKKHPESGFIPWVAAATAKYHFHAVSLPWSPVCRVAHPNCILGTGPGPSWIPE